jgi:hypothetical protein
MLLTEQAQRRRTIWLTVALSIALSAMHVPKFLGPEPDLAENRVLADFPERPSDLAGWLALPKGIDAYVQDRFPVRGRLIAWLNMLRYRVGDSGSARVIVGERGWLFYDDGNQMGAARAAVPLTPAETAAWVRTLSARTQRLADAGIPYLVLVPPVKERVYPEFAPDWFVDGGPATDALALGRAAQAAGHDNVEYLLPDLLRAKYESPPAYSRFDTHWTGFGAHRAYLALARRLADTDAAIEAWPIDRYRQLPAQQAKPRDLALMLGIAGFVHQEYPQHEFAGIGREPKTVYLTERRDWTGDRVIETGRPGPVLLWTGDSFSNELLPLLYPHFSKLIVSHNQEGYFREDLIEAYRPDVVVTEVLESGVRHAMNPPMEPAPTRAVESRDGVGDASPRGAAFRAETQQEAALRKTEPAGGPCNLEIAKLSRGAGGETVVHLEGWMFDAAKGRSAATTTVLMLAEGEGASWRVVVPNEVRREDVAERFGVPAAANSGFSADIGLAPAVAKSLAAGGERRFLLRQRYGGDGIGCAAEREIEIVGR